MFGLSTQIRQSLFCLYLLKVFLPGRLYPRELSTAYDCNIYYSDRRQPNLYAPKNNVTWLHFHVLIDIQKVNDPVLDFTNICPKLLDRHIYETRTLA